MLVSKICNEACILYKTGNKNHDSFSSLFVMSNTIQYNTSPTTSFHTQTHTHIYFILFNLQNISPQIALAEFGHLALMGACDVVDDTVLLKKTLLQDIAKTVETLANDAYGRKVLNCSN